MPYLPPEVLNDTIFPTAGMCDRDVVTTLDLISERWSTSFPQVAYHMIAWTPTVALPENDYASGVSNETTVDDLWGEDIDYGEFTDQVAATRRVRLDNTGKAIIAETKPIPIQFDEAVGAKWEQPHGNADRAAANTRKWKDPVNIHAQINTDKMSKVIRRLGLDDFKGLLLTIPTVMVDRAGIVVNVGDRFYWDAEPWDVVQMFVRDRWFNTNVYLYIHIHAQRGRDNSS